LSLPRGRDFAVLFSYTFQRTVPRRDPIGRPTVFPFVYSKEWNMPPGALFDLSQLDFSKVVVPLEKIRLINPQRFEMEQLSAIVHIDAEQRVIIGYKDVAQDEFWVRGHMPGYPLMPGVLMCEAAAQISSYFCVASGLLKGDFIGFSGLENVRFRGVVRPGDRLVLIAKGISFRTRRAIFNVQGFVGSVLVFEGDILGVPMSRGSGAAVEGGES
jgi:3-hydroxyacyl-[acyl-carrier-protein] dehydratase